MASSVPARLRNPTTRRAVTVPAEHPSGVSSEAGKPFGAEHEQGDDGEYQKVLPAHTQHSADSFRSSGRKRVATTQ